MREETLSSLQVSAFNIGVMSDVLESAGIDPRPAFESIGLDAGNQLLPTGSVSARSELTFERAFLALTPLRRDLWTEVGRRHRLYAYGIFGTVIGTAPTLRHWVRASGNTRDLCFSFIEFRPVYRKGALCGVEYGFEAVPEELREMLLYRDLGAASSVISEIWNASMEGFCVELARPESEGEVLRGVFPFEVKFDCPKTMVTWPSEVSDIPLPNGSEYLHRYYSAQCAGLLDRLKVDSLATRVVEVITAQPSICNSVEPVAKRLNMSVRTLQRRLQRDGASFREVLIGAHADIAKLYLETTAWSIAQIAAQLGYANRTSFDIAFSRWTGVSPCRFRALAGGEVRPSLI